MHYYNRNLGDYAKKAGRLSMLQHGAYTLLLDACYDREQFPTLAEAIDWTWASSTAEIEAVEFVLRKFFTLEGDRYVQKRIEEEVANYRAKSATNARIAQEREAKRKENSTKRARVVNEEPAKQHEAPPNQEPITNNQEPKEEGRARKRAAPPVPAVPVGLEDVPPTLLADYARVRTAKHAGAFTQTAADGLLREAQRAGIPPAEAIRACCEFGWIGFNAAWYAERKGNPSRASPAAETAYQRSMRERVEAFSPAIARRPPGAQRTLDVIEPFDVEVRDVTAIAGH